MQTTAMQHSGRALAWLRAVGLCLLGTWASLAQAAAPTQVWQAVSDRTLDTQRGGFFFGGGLEVSFGITRSVYINGELITETVLNIARMADITPAWAARLREELQSITLIQNGPGNTFVTGAGPTNSQQTTAASGTTPASAPGSAPANTASSSAGNSSTNAVPPTSTAVTSVVAGTASGTVIQNTLNNQQILHQTIINATSNGLGMLKLSTLHSTLSDAIRQSVGVQ